MFDQSMEECVRHEVMQSGPPIRVLNEQSIREVGIKEDAGRGKDNNGYV